ncbi:hypothetical protein [Arthrobacter sp. Soil736]|uniref:hypothetical protein n=1 Tax=Arthrobacter sp. Soil736 TaxID=1736395 RepID=UPI0012F7E1AF|nr:hypothetical protein [Arthrobacter sp. Soil736]
MRLEGLLSGLKADLQRQMEQTKTASADIQAKGLPVIAAGILLCAVPTELAFWPAVGWVAFLLAWGFTVWITVLSAKSGLWRIYGAV